jgi:hypothetical protein
MIVKNVAIKSNIPNKEWNFIKTEKCEIYTCKCETKITYHPNFMIEEIPGCIKCESIEIVAKRLLEFRSFTFVSEIREGKKKDIKIQYICDKKHDCKDLLTNIRKGKGCKECGQIGRRTEKKTVEKVNCNCKELGLATHINSSTYVCPHYNFEIMNPEAMKDWNYEKNNENGFFANKMAPRSGQKCHFICRVYNQLYEQTLNDVTTGKRCSYCYGSAICLGNSLATLRPDLLLEWDPDNIIKPTEIRLNTHTVVKWICYKGGIPFKYECSPNQRGSKMTGSCCARCQKGFEQLTGGHDYFVKIANEVHNNKYEYNEKYVTCDTLLNIYCPVISIKTKSVHGNFLQAPDSHKKGNGCPKCNNERTESKGVTDITILLTKWYFIINTHYIKEKRFFGMKYISELALDFFIIQNTIKNKYPIAIEYDGENHFADKGNWVNSEITRKRDLRKDLFCISNNISLLRIPFNIKITEEFLSNLLRNCEGDKLCYFSYKHYQDEVIPKLPPNSNYDIRKVDIPAKYNDLKCSFED